MMQPDADVATSAPRRHYLWRAVTLVPALVFCALFGIVVVLIVWSPGRPAPLIGDDGRVIAGTLSERVFLDINGIRQGMIIQSANPAHPILLFLHGGPGLPDFLLNTTHPTSLERDFTVVWWEQRGAGLSYHPGIPPDTMTTSQLIRDTIAVTEYLRVRFGQDRIYLLGHSWGSFLDIQIAASAPDRFHAYIGMGHISSQLQSEGAAHAYLLDAYRAQGDGAMVRRLEVAPLSLTLGLSDEWMRLRDGAMQVQSVGTCFAQLDAPVKGIYTFQNSAHSPLFDEPERARQILQQDVFPQANHLADVTP